MFVKKKNYINTLWPANFLSGIYENKNVDPVNMTWTKTQYSYVHFLLFYEKLQSFVLLVVSSLIMLACMVPTFLYCLLT